MTSNIILTSQNIVPGTNNSVLVYRFPNSVQFSNHEISVSSISMFNSWQNINNTTLMNNTLTYTWESSTNAVTSKTITIPSGLYEIAQINAYCQFVMIQNGHYLVNSSGQNVYFFEFVVKPNSLRDSAQHIPISYCSTLWLDQSRSNYVSNSGDI